MTTIKGTDLSIKIDGVERRDGVHGLEWETTNQGDGGGSFWMEPNDPFYPQSTWSELRHGASFDVTHTLSGTVKQLYKGFIVSDPRAGYAGESKRLEVELGGALDAARWRGDVGFIYTDSDPDQWFENKFNPKWATVDIGDHIYVGVDEDTRVTYGSNGPKAAVVSYMIYPGFHHMLTKLNGIRRIRGKVTCNLKDDMKARLVWAEGYTASREVNDARFTTIKTWTTDTVVKEEVLDETFATGGTKAGYLALLLWTTNSKGVTVTNERFIVIDNVEVYSDTSEKSIDQGMLAIADYCGLHGGSISTDTATIGSVVESLVARPPTDPVSALGLFAEQADKLVEWGWFGYYSSGSYFQFRAKPMLTNPTTIRNATNCYAIDATAPGATWDVRQHPEEGIPRAVRLLYGRKGKNSNYPAGFPASVIAPIHPGFTSGIPFKGALCRVLTVDFTAHNYTDGYATKMAKKLARHLSMGLSTGTVTLKNIDVHRWSSGTTWRPAAYIRGGDWVECHQANCGPLYVTRSHVDLDSETVELDVGIGADKLIEQLEAAGGVFKHRLAKRRRHPAAPGPGPGKT